MADTLFTNGTVVQPAWLNDANTAVYDKLTAVTGTNTILATGPLSLTAYANGQNFYLVPAVTNTGPVTINISGLGAVPLTKTGATALIAGDLVAGAVYEISYDGVRFQVLNASTISVPAANITGQVAVANGGTGAATAAAALVNLGATGRLIGVQTFTTTGVYTPTAGTTRVLVVGEGAGGGGGGCGAVGAGQLSLGGGGGAGGYAASFLTTGFSGVTVTIGAGGAPGNTGSASSFGGLITFTPGNGGSVGAANSNQTASGGTGGVPTGGNLFNIPGQPGASCGSGFAGGVVLSGGGATSKFGAGGRGFGTGGGSVGGESASGRGAGGGGAAGYNSGGAQSGGSGAPAIVMIYEYS